ncbi:MAG: hypothetical protein ACXABY_36260 [Candidatus Thorarchaeota archaeon]
MTLTKDKVTKAAKTILFQSLIEGPEYITIGSGLSYDTEDFKRDMEALIAEDTGNCNMFHCWANKDHLSCVVCNFIGSKLLELLPEAHDLVDILKLYREDLDGI